jgi:molybdate transport system substrate-binding protein
MSRNERTALAAKGCRAGLGNLALIVCALFSLPLQASSVEASGSVRVLYAGSLVQLMEHALGPAFDKASGDRFEGYPGGSKLLAHEIRAKLRPADVFISAAPKVMKTLEGKANGGWVAWSLAFARSPLVIGYHAKSRFAGDFKTKPWYEVLQEPGLRLGRTDPKLDPKGALTLLLMRKAEVFYKMPGLSHRILGAPENPAQVLPEETLVGRLQSGEIDAGFFYSTETAEAHIPALALPASIASGAQYTATILKRAPNPEGAARFLAFLLGPEGRRLLKEHGLSVEKPALSGRAPSAIRALIKKAQ